MKKVRSTDDLGAIYESCDVSMEEVGASMQKTLCLGSLYDTTEYLFKQKNILKVLFIYVLMNYSCNKNAPFVNFQPFFSDDTH